MEEKEKEVRKLYVLINNRLNSVYGCVQGAHAVAQWLLDNKEEQQWNNEYLFFLSANLDEWIPKLTKNGYAFSEFHEPDLCGTITAIAIENNGLIFNKLELIK